MIQILKSEQPSGCDTNKSKHELSNDEVLLYSYGEQQISNDGYTVK